MIEFIAEIGNNHNGDIEIAKKLIDASHLAGIQYVKFQKRQMDMVYTQEQLDAPRESPWGKTYGEYRDHLEFGYDEYCSINLHCMGKARWFATPFDVESLSFLMMFDPPFIKIGSPQLTDDELLAECRFYNAPVIMSCGMANLEMIDHAIDVVGKNQIYCLMQCNSTYPTKASELNLRVITMLKERYPEFKIGFSNHFSGLTGMIAAVALGAEMIEFHVTLDRAMYGSDHAASIEPQGMFQLTKHCRTVEEALGDGKKYIYESEYQTIERLRKHV